MLRIGLTVADALAKSLAAGTNAGHGMTPRGWWLLFITFVLLLCGMLTAHALLVILGLGLLLWFGWEWFLFNLRVQTTLRHLRLERVLEDERGPIPTLSYGR